MDVVGKHARAMQQMPDSSAQPALQLADISQQLTCIAGYLSVREWGAEG